MEQRLNSWIAFLDEHDQRVERFCTFIDRDVARITFTVGSGSPNITIPWSRVLKLKEAT